MISPDEMNEHIGTVIIALMTTSERSYPTRIPCLFENRKGQIELDQIRTVDKSTLAQRVGRLDRITQGKVLAGLMALFAE